MKISTLIFCSLFALIANAQTKEAEFKKMETLLKQSNGVTTSDLKIIESVFSETSVKVKVNSGGKAASINYSGMDWDGFEFSIEEMEDNEEVLELMISFEETFKFAYYENNKLTEEDTDDMISLYFKASQAAQIKKQMEELQAYTWKSFNKVRGFDKNELVSFITKNLNTAVEDIDCKVKSVTGCEISFVSEEGDEIVLQTKNMKIHEKEFLSDEYLICYGKQTAVVKTKIGRTYKSQNMEHPELELVFDDNSIFEMPRLLEFAIKRLAAYCNN